MSSYRSRGVTPPQATATALRGLVTSLGDHEVARLLGQSRATVARLVARLPVLESVLYTAEGKLPAIIARARLTA